MIRTCDEIGYAVGSQASAPGQLKQPEAVIPATASTPAASFSDWP